MIYNILYIILGYIIYIGDIDIKYIILIYIYKYRLYGIIYEDYICYIKIYMVI